MQSIPVRSTILEKTDRVIAVGEALASSCQVIDVRSPGEYIAGAIPGAINVPLFDEDERGMIGSIYRHGGHAQAVDQGFELVEKRLATLLLAFQPYHHQNLVICCARGGMRSLSVVNLLSQAGFSVCQLKGGYKEYRRQVLDQLEGFQPRLIVLHGLTGTGKTRILQRLSQSIDLEELAGHRSSLFGGLYHQASNQRTFESRLAERSATLGAEPYFIEGESRKIGKVFIPKPLAAAMKGAVLVNIHCSLETRIARIIEDYPVTDQETMQQIETILKSLKRTMGAEQVEKMCALLREGNLTELVRILLVDYYDKRYARSMSKYRFDLEISVEDLDAAAARLEEFRESLRAVGSSDGFVTQKLL